ncbi:arginyl-tRNA synthetase family protein [Hibiscus syriacus]|uniref:Arginyl-tRNA synthetase family protein n=1 Tax=Hibiscus syriacus TaxID=106335 RepID=A0A6A3A1A2_HIBSY|nr:uncharacterized protein LOC120135331 [Hibiscus syriacus]KAE8697938.1 arginyl-tRNA synthetase family protein [Hibiscus syriacus]
MKLSTMPKKNSDGAAQRAWRVLRLLLLWTRKSGVFKRRLVMELRSVPKFLKGLGHTKAASPHQINFNERQLSFDETPIFHVKMHRPASMRFLLPCISPEEVDFGYDFGTDGDDGVYGYDSGRKSNSTGEQGRQKETECGNDKSSCPPEEEGIDSKADKFIAQFYEQMKLQRQISYLEYTEMLNRGAS